MQLNLESYHAVVRKIVENADGESRITVLVADKTDGDPIGLATFLEHGYADLDKAEPACSHADMKEQLGLSNRKSFYELQYIVRSSTRKGRAIGDVLLACGLEALSNAERKRPATVCVWLQLAGSFHNSNALILYTRYRLRVVGFAEGRIPVLSLSDVHSCLERAKSPMAKQLVLYYLLPVLKEECGHVSFDLHGGGEIQGSSQAEGEDDELSVASTESAGETMSHCMSSQGSVSLEVERPPNAP